MIKNIESFISIFYCLIVHLSCTFSDHFEAHFIIEKWNEYKSFGSSEVLKAEREKKSQKEFGKPRKFFEKLFFLERLWQFF